MYDIDDKADDSKASDLGACAVILKRPSKVTNTDNPSEPGNIAQEFLSISY